MAPITEITVVGGEATRELLDVPRTLTSLRRLCWRDMSAHKRHHPLASERFFARSLRRLKFLARFDYGSSQYGSGALRLGHAAFPRAYTERALEHAPMLTPSAVVRLPPTPTATTPMCLNRKACSTWHTVTFGTICIWKPARTQSVFFCR